MFSMRVALLLVLAPLVACDDGPTNPSPVDVMPETFSITPETLEMKVGDIVALRINGVSTQLLAIWTSDNPAIASVVVGGLVRGNQAGTATITAYVGDKSASVPVVVR